MAEKTERFGLPLLVPGQGQKDVTHNEALLALDAMVQPIALSRSIAEPPANPGAGDGWVVPEASTGAWSGASGQLATWTAGGWRLYPLPEGARVWVIDEGRSLRRADGGWVPEVPFGAPAASVAGPGGGTVVDVEARAAIHMVLDRLRELGLILP
jgi:hypothetical protein